MNGANYWADIYATRSPEDVSWYEPTPTVSLRKVREAIRNGARSLIDIGGGASSLVDHLIDFNLSRLAVLDISERGLEVGQARLGKKANGVEWIVGDVTKEANFGRFDVWHDRAVFHFLTDPAHRGCGRGRHLRA